MYLSRIEIFGFKSFATKTRVAFNDGVTAIVGPNGCGKTNIVDALRWVLGEQRYSVIRSDRMEDVIFNGTKLRKPIGLAEVSLTIQNTKGILPSEYTDVTITRRLFRSGESEYLLNRTPCRLKDIVTLFMDTGMGANAYSVIELKMVESILSDRTEERRHLFEEAAGITRYKARRKETYRRLDDVQADLLRVDDIIAEVEKTVASLERQAKKAERYKTYADQLRRLEIDVTQRDFSSLLGRLDPLLRRLEENRSLRSTFQQKMEMHETLLAEAHNEEREIEAELDRSRRRQAELVESINENERSLLQKRERVIALRESIGRWTAAAGESGTRIEAETLRRAEFSAACGSLSTALAQSAAAWEERKARHAAIDARVSGKKLAIASLQSRHMEIVHDLSARKNDLQNLTEAREQAAERLAEIAREREEQERLLSAGREEFQSRTRGEVTLKENVLHAERAFHEMEEKKQNLKTEIDQLQNIAFEIQSRIGEKMTRIDFLNSLVERMAGYSESVQYLLQHHDWRASQATTVAELINTRPELRACIESVLGETAHYIVVADISEAISGIAKLKQNQVGKATFVCTGRLPAVTPVPFPIAGSGILGWAIDLISFPDAQRRLCNFLFRNVLIVEDAATANACIREYPSLRCVTVEGDVFDSAGILRGGVHKADEGGLIGKREQIEELSRQVAELKVRLEENQGILQEKNREYGEIDLRKHADDIKTSQQELSALERQCAQMLFEVHALEAAIARLDADRQAVLEQQSAAADKLALLQPELDRLTAEEQALGSQAEEEAKLLASLEQEYAASFSEVNEANVTLVRKTAELKNLENEIARIDSLIASERESIERTGREIAEAESSTALFDGEIAALEGTLSSHRAEKEEIDRAALVTEERLISRRGAIDGLERALREERESHTQSVNLVHETELKVSEIHQRLDALRTYAREELAMELQETVPAEDDIFDLGQAKDDIHTLKGKIQSIGPVNQLAFEEYRAEKERLDLLISQRADLLEAEKNLKQTIDEISRTAEQKFRETFALIRDNFISIFKSLFEEGDEADLLLQEPEDPLETPIDIIAKPRGKRPHSIEMLSGGEKTLTAIALLFAIYLVKPSPFCILDEVDAPLDDANIDRFIRIIRRFSENTQFIIVTHNKRTMEAADTLYGVTMEEEGISKIVSVRFGEKNMPEFSSN